MGIRLSTILGIQSTSRNFKEMYDFLYKEIQTIPGVTLYYDGAQNLYAVKGKGPYPAFACHTDTVHPIRDGYKIHRMEPSHVWFAYYEKDGKLQPTGIGGDDKCGIFICLKLLEKLENVKCFFFSDEEIGCVGSAASDKTFLKDCKWVIQCDRKHSFDIIVNGAGTRLCSEEFEKDLAEIGEKFGYKPTNGSVTDVVQLKESGDLEVSAVNISVGYWNPHSKSERIVESEVIKALDFCLAAADKLDKVYPHKHEKVYVKPTRYKSWHCEATGCVNFAGKNETLCKACLRSIGTKDCGIVRCLICQRVLAYPSEMSDQICNTCYAHDYNMYNN